MPEENVVGVLAPAANRVETLTTRTFVVASSCSICGKTSIEEVCREIPPLGTDNFTISSSVLYSLPETLRLAQQAFNLTGGLHAAGLFDSAGKLLVLREDIGRHNAVDKVIGWSALKERYPLDERILLVSGRCSFEIIQKALTAGIPVVVSISAPSSLAVELAREGGLTLAGFLRGRRMNVYSEPQRILPE